MTKNKSRGTLIHFICWLVIFLLPYLNYIIEPEKLLTTKTVFLVVPFMFNVVLMLFFYANLLFLAPRFMNKGKWPIYVLIIIAGFGLFYLYNRGIFNFLILPELTRDVQAPKDPNNNRRDAFRLLFPILFYSLSLLASIVLYLFNERRKEKEITRLIEFEKVEAELNMLKLQISPHFLFNTLNNIRWLVRKKSEESEESILKLSEILRYIIYDVNVDKVSIRQEVDHLRNYINLQSLRIQADAKIDFEVDPKAESLLIAPLLFIHFVENAFKYGVDGKNTTDINISIKKKEKGILFTCRNKILNPANSLKNSGVGITNVKRRLELIYPNQYQLSLAENDGYFDVILNLQIHEN